MIFDRCEIPDLVVVKPHRLEDHRGYFTRTFCVDEFEGEGLPSSFPQCNNSFNSKKGTLRGMHFQNDPYPEGKLVRCTAGRIFDVALDLRPESKTFLQWKGFELSRENGMALFIPPGFAHGFQTLEDHCEVFYMMTAKFQPGYAGGYRWNDPAFKIEWPLDNPVLSDKDQAYEDFPL